VGRINVWLLAASMMGARYQIANASRNLPSRLGPVVLSGAALPLLDDGLVLRAIISSSLVGTTHALTRELSRVMTFSWAVRAVPFWIEFDTDELQRGQHARPHWDSVLADAASKHDASQPSSLATYAPMYLTQAGSRICRAQAGPGVAFLALAITWRMSLLTPDTPFDATLAV